MIFAVKKVVSRSLRVWSYNLICCFCAFLSENSHLSGIKYIESSTATEKLTGCNHH